MIGDRTGFDLEPITIPCQSRVAASLGPGLKTASAAERSLGEKLSPGAVCPVTGESSARDCNAANEKRTQTDDNRDEVG
jgi:hypothetical protein